mmetsp:Transcript_8300/g.17336  ORF Transcript_8300/g.17336 Transcript_8300/m.17336 type:complete len:817 (+) Transcript_8300:140-2590(+)
MTITAQFVRSTHKVVSPTMPKKDLASKQARASAPLLPPSDETRTNSPHDNDVLCGRGGCINSHPGNEQYRKFVERKKRVYLTARFKREKRLIAESIVAEVRKLDPPGRFLTKDARSDFWYDIGDEKARDKTSQALRENATTVRKEMEEEFRETRKQQAREVAIAAGRDPDEAERIAMGENLAQNDDGNEKKPDGPPQSDEDHQDGIVIPPQSGFTAPRYGHHPMMPPPTQWGYNQGGAPVPHPNAPHPPHVSYNPHAPPPHSHYTQVGPYYSQHPHAPPPHQGNPPYRPHHVHQPHGTHRPQYPPPPSTSYHHPNSSSNWGMPPPSRHSTQHPTIPPNLSSHPPLPARSMLQPRPGIYLAPSPTAPKQVQFQYQDQKQPYRDTINDTATTTQCHSDIPLIIRSKTRHSDKGSQRKSSLPAETTTLNANNDESSYGSLILSQQSHHQNQVLRQPPHSPQLSIFSSIASGNGDGEGKDIGEASNMSQCTPLDFVSNFSAKSSDTLNYLIGEDEIEGDVGQEVELVAHAPLTREYDHGGDDDRDNKTTIGDATAVSSLASMSTYNKSEYATPPRHGKSRRRKPRGDHIPSNSGKVKIDWSLPPNHAGRGSGNVAASSSFNGGGLPCATGACTGILPSPIVGRNSASRRSSQNASGVNTPMHPLSPNSLDLDKMSLCGTEIISHGGGSLGGASLCNVFEEHDSITGASVLMDMSMSLGSHDPSSGGSTHTPAPIGQHGGYTGGNPYHPNIFRGSEGMIGSGALMDMSVGSGSNSKAPSNGSGGSKSSQGSSSGSKSSGLNPGRSISPASVDKNTHIGDKA